MGATPSTDVYAPIDGTIAGITPYVLNGAPHGMRIDIRPLTAPALIVSVTRLQPDPSLTVGSAVAAGRNRIGEVLDLSRVRTELGYRDVVPAREAIGRTARWLRDHSLVGSTEEHTLTDPFDYDAEDRLVDAWLAARASIPAFDGEVEPRWGLAYSGPGGRPRSQATFED